MGKGISRSPSNHIEGGRARGIQETTLMGEGRGSLVSLVYSNVEQRLN